MKDKCADCKKEVNLRDLIQVINPTKETKYKSVCEQCFKKGSYKFVGRWK